MSNEVQNVSEETFFEDSKVEPVVIEEPVTKKYQRGKYQHKAMQLPCSVCKQLKWAGAPRVDKLVQKFETVEKLLETYKCGKCRKD